MTFYLQPISERLPLRVGQGRGVDDPQDGNSSAAGGDKKGQRSDTAKRRKTADTIELLLRNQSRMPDLLRQ